MRYSDHVEGRGDEFFQEACRAGLEGIVAKRAGGPYRAGRGRDWLKVKCLLRQELAIVGYTDPEGARTAFGALHLAVRDPEVAEHGGLVYAGKVGTGFDERTLSDLHRRLMGRYPRYKYLGLTTREAGQTKKVYIQDVITSGELEEHLGAALDPAKTHVFLCGNPKMIGVPTRDKATGAVTYPQPPGVIEILEHRGFRADVAATKTRGNIHFEEYW